MLAVAACARLGRFRDALVSGTACALDGDSAYHLGRMRAALRDFPRVPAFDPFLNWPRGGSVPWADGFDVLGACFARIASTGGAEEADVALLLWPVVLGVLVVWATVDLTRRLAGPGEVAAPLAAGLLVAVEPTSVWVSRFGMTDHHVAESLTMIWLTSWALEVGSPNRDGGASAAWRWEAAGLVATTAALWMFSGGALYVAIAAVPLAVRSTRGNHPGTLLGTGAPAFLAGAALSALLSIPAMKGHGHVLSYRFPSLLQPGLVALAGIAIASVAVVRRKFPADRGLRRLAVPVAVLAILVVVVGLAFPPLVREVAGAVTGFLLARDPWLAGIVEFQSPLASRANFPGGVGGLLQTTGVLTAVAMALLPAAVWVAWPRSHWRAACFGWNAGALVLLSLLQVRFIRVSTPLLMSGMGLVSLGLIRWGRRTVRWPGLVGPAALLATAIAVLTMEELRHQLAWTAPVPPDSLARVASALELARPPVQGARDGVLIPWDHASWFSARTGRPVVANGFGTFVDETSFRDVREAFLGDEDQLVGVMDRHDLGLLVAGGIILMNHQPRSVNVPPTIGKPAALNPEYMRALPLSQLLIAGSGIPSVGLPSLGKLLPIHASQSVASNLGSPLPILWAYERVPGAVLEGRATPGTRVLAEIPLVEWGRQHRYRAWADAGADGRWTMRVALPSAFHRATLRSGDAWTLHRVGRPDAFVTVPEASVRQGETIAIGD